MSANDSVSIFNYEVRPYLQLIYICRMNETESQEKSVKFLHLYEISRAIQRVQLVDELCPIIIKKMSLVWSQDDHFFPLIEIHDKCYKSDNFPYPLASKFSAPILIDGKNCGQVSLFYKDISFIKWSENEDAIYLQNIANDIAFRLQREQAADAQVLLLQDAQSIENAVGQHVGLAITNTSGKINYASKKFCSISGYSAEELLGQDYRVIHSAFYCEDSSKTLWDTISNGMVWKGSLKNCTPEGFFYWIEATLVPIVDATQFSGKYVVIWMDATTYKQSAEKMQAQIKELVRSNSELEQFAYVVTHDLQEPLRAINGFVQMLRKYSDHQLDERANTLISHVVSGTDRMQALIADLLTYAQIDGNQALVEVDCEKLLNNVLTDLLVVINECNAVITHEKLPIVKGIPFQLIQLFNNLINNALKFRREQPPKIHIGIEENLVEWVFSVADNGIGIEEQYLERIFKVFQRLHTRREYVGTGIGLSICKKVVEYHHGKIWINSQPNVGSTVYFTVPKSIEVLL